MNKKKGAGIWVRTDLPTGRLSALFHPEFQTLFTPLDPARLEWRSHYLTGFIPVALQKAKQALQLQKAKQALRLQDGKCPVESAEGGAAKPQFHRAATVGIDFFKGTRLALRERIGESG